MERVLGHGLWRECMWSIVMAYGLFLIGEGGFEKRRIYDLYIPGNEMTEYAFAIGLG